MRRQRDPNRTAKPEVLAVLKELLARPDIQSAHYVGYAHEPVLRLLNKRFGTGFSVMDYWDRYGQGAAFLADDDLEGAFPARPEWLEGVEFYCGGRPVVDLLIWDILFTAQVWESLTWPHPRRRPPNYILLVDEAREATGYPNYTWTETGHYSLGVLKLTTPRRCHFADRSINSEQPVAGIEWKQPKEQRKIVSGDTFRYQGRFYQYRGQDAQGVYHACLITPRTHVTFRDTDGWELFWSARGDQ